MSAKPGVIPKCRVFTSGARNLPRKPRSLVKLTRYRLLSCARLAGRGDPAGLLGTAVHIRHGFSRRKNLMPQTKNKTNRWVAKVKTGSTHPPKGLFTKSAATIARALASKKVSPKGPSSGMRMLTYFINRAGRGLSAARRAELQKAKTLLHNRIEREKKSAGKSTSA